MPILNLPALIRALLIWLLILVAESALGSLRRALAPDDLEFVIRQASVLLSTVVIFVITWLSFRWMAIRSDRGALAVGLAWAALTLAFEVVAGRAMGASWSRIGSDYDLAHGGLMPLGLALMALTPWAVRRLKAKRPEPGAS